MAKYYGDLPCVRIGNTIHITENAFKCVCGQSWSYGRPTERESLHNNNIIWRDISAVSCEKCRSLYTMILLSEFDVEDFFFVDDEGNIVPRK